MYNKIYDWGVKKNEYVQKEYERYVQENLAEHYENRLKQWKILMALNWHYRVKKNTEPMLYFDNPKQEEHLPVSFVEPLKTQKSIFVKKNDSSNSKETSKDIIGSKKTDYPESEKLARKEIERIIKDVEKYDIVSFDMFDTLVFRMFSDPKDLFWLVGNELFIPNFKVIRTNIEKELRKQNKNGEVTLDEIYEVIEKRFGVPKRKGIEIELKYEMKVCFANPYIYEVYRVLKQQGKKMIVTSNMYMNKEQLRRILDRCKYTEIDEIFVSCEYSVNKKYGKLQKKVHEEVGKEKNYSYRR